MVTHRANWLGYNEAKQTCRSGRAFRVGLEFQKKGSYANSQCHFATRASQFYIRYTNVFHKSFLAALRNQCAADLYSRLLHA